MGQSGSLPIEPASDGGRNIVRSQPVVNPVVNGSFGQPDVPPPPPAPAAAAAVPSGNRISVGNRRSRSSQRRRRRRHEAAIAVEPLVRNNGRTTDEWAMGVRVASGDRDVPRDLVFPHVGEIDNVNNHKY